MLLMQKFIESTSTIKFYNVVKGVEVRMFTIANTSASEVTYRIHRKRDSSTANKGNALLYDVKLPANSTELIEYSAGSFIMNANEDIWVRCGTSGAVTFTLDGDLL